MRHLVCVFENEAPSVVRSMCLRVVVRSATFRSFICLARPPHACLAHLIQPTKSTLVHEQSVATVGRHFDKKPPNLGQPLSFLSLNLAQTLKFLKSQMKNKALASQGVLGAAASRGSPSLPFQAATNPCKNCFFRD